MEKENGKAVHCVVLAYPAQGHINPMIQFSKRLLHEGVKVTLVTTLFYGKSLENFPPSMSFETISDGFDNGRHGEGLKLSVYNEVFAQRGSQTLSEVLEKCAVSGYPVDCIIYDSFMPWALDVAKKFGIAGASYLTQNMPVNSVYYHVHIGKLRAPLTEDEILIPMLPKLQHRDMPSFFLSYQEDPAFLEMLVEQFSNIHEADWVLCNAFYELEKEVIDWTKKIWPKFRTIGPSIPSMFLDKRLKDDEEYGVTQFKSEECMDWLDKKAKGSVLYVSFGSLVPLDEEQIREVAYGLRDSGRYFLWVVRASEEAKLPKDFAKNSEKGLVVTWCSQLKVLSHEAVGCFVTHCGWNSTLEALSLGVPVIAVPQWSDQATNAKYLVDVWKVGIRPVVDEKKIMRKEALEDCIKELMESDKGKEIRINAVKLKNLAIEAVSEGGSSNKNIIEFVNSLKDNYYSHSFEKSMNKFLAKTVIVH
ncbi:hypothetical protein HN51_006037 [Arachis hypogaea]